ncbi:anhydro-N-acetylmuramic acid kinase [Gluconacetobacter entanii]|uniref:Anhydro-N-acetylmuramic acid kinase n=2 Tax=Gluconacetobacter entanii TaxID=108528 RepID=A0ABT3K176_9PROT|nr:anhydro-N-acetylmuramic acid kinase [Gluconacetobacter entanii]MCW4589157.1 anhydro-N-acetylmuramic acid kinase [Gluconacetobacter entanii]MCW4592696.1 anhydro-N-acetylmuramic acid kinase [Gluconacetobacter entanii]
MMGMLHAIGLMSGTSLDGVDAALVETDGHRVGARGPSLSLPYAPALRERMRDLLDRAPTLPADAPEVRAVERELTLRHAEAVQALREKAGNPHVDVIGFHGQTLLHQPQAHRTWQVGDADLLWRETGIPVVYDFRSADVANGGEGAPLVPFYHAALLAGRERPVAIVNIGGVSNVTLLDTDGRVHACDTGPGNALLDDWARIHTGHPCDIDGQLASAGQVDADVLHALLSDPFFARPAPKSLDRQSFHRALSMVSHLSAQDGAATLAAFTVAAIASVPLPQVPRAWYICGGGVHNPAIMRGLRACLPGIVAPVSGLGWDGDALEAECFGFLAVRSLLGLPISAPETTGVSHPLTGGCIVGAPLRA